MENKRFFDRLADLFFPQKCVFCGKITGNMPVCPECEAKLPRFSGTTHHKEFFTKCTGAFRYDGIVRDSILRFKFGGHAAYAAAYAPFVADAVRRELDRYDIISWTPLSAKRLRKRGYNQAELTARETAKLLNVPAAATLKKLHDVPPQSGIAEPAARRANVMGAYSVLPRADIAGKTVLLIDDVVTSGATLSECSRELLMAGAADVVCAVIAVAKDG